MNAAPWPAPKSSKPLDDAAMTSAPQGDVWRVLDVDAFIESQTLSPFLIGVIGLATLAILIDGFDASALAYAVTALSKTLGVGPAAFGAVFGITLAGYLVGAFFIGIIGDTAGRKSAVVLASLWTGCTALATVLAHSLAQLIAIRFLAGMGIGALVPAAMVLTSDFAPKRWIGAIVLLNGCGIPAGNLVAGLAAGALVTDHGWPALFLLGGAGSIAVGVAIAVLVPTSPRKLVLAGDDPARIRKVLSVMRSPAPLADAFVLGRPESNLKFHVRHLLKGDLAISTPLLWLAFILASITLWFMYSWLPTLLETHGATQRNAAYFSTLFSIGGILGLLGLAPLIERFGPASVLLPAVVAVADLALLQPLAGMGLQVPGLFVAGAACSMVQSGLVALAAMSYPDSCRSCGVGWLIGVGKVGAIAGPVAGGWLIGAQMPAGQIFPLVGAPLMLAAVCLAILIGRRRRVRL